MSSANFNPTTRMLRQFGAIGLFVFALLAARAYFAHRLVGFHLGSSAAEACAAALLALAGACAAAAALAPSALRPLYRAMMLVAFPIGWAVSHAILGALFHGLITPLGLAMRLAGRDPLQLRRRSDETYWRPRGPQRDTASYFRQT